MSAYASGAAQNRSHPSAPDSRTTVLVIDAESVLSRALCEELVNERFGVIAHVRQDEYEPFPKPVTVLSVRSIVDAIEAGGDSLSPIGHVVFGQYLPRGTDAQSEDFEDIAALLEEDLVQFLAELQATGGLLARNEAGQLWVLTLDGGIRYYADVPCLPVDTHARHAAVKSLAKELFRFGVRANCAHVQLLAEQAAPDVWQRAREDLKAYAMKFRANSSTAVARTLVRFIGQADLPFAGMIVPIGIGFSESNI